jgi:hypothetical protein
LIAGELDAHLANPSRAINGLADELQSGYGGKLSCMRLLRRNMPERTMAYRTTLTCLSLSLLLFAYLPAEAGSSEKHNKAEKDHSSKRIVYVCACLNNKSCSCMTESKMEGPCACGTQGGPPMKAVGADSDWAKENREALAK